MVEVIGGVRVGVNVDIKRTDGRIHSAVVSGVNIETRSVTVEWLERGETKGKEMDLNQILSLNQEFAPMNHDKDKSGKKYTPRPSHVVVDNKHLAGASGVQRNK